MPLPELSDIRTASRAYEAWLRLRCPLVAQDLRAKHDAMAAGFFPFLRATFYRWMELWPRTCASLSSAPRVIGVGDLHVANFGTWRDRYDRLCWGVNDFDEAAPLPYTQDLVRLATSAVVAIEDGYLRISAKTACGAILAGYDAAMTAGGKPIVLAEQHRKLCALVTPARKDDPERFWARARNELKVARAAPPNAVRTEFGRAFPPQARLEIFTRRGGLGALGKPRYVAIAPWHGARIAYEVKAVTRSAALWAQGASPKGAVFSRLLEARALRSPDPHLVIGTEWLRRRYGPSSGRIDLTTSYDRRDTRRLLRAMGWETANVHLGTRHQRGRIRIDLAQRNEWLLEAADAMTKALRRDWKAWRRHRPYQTNSGVAP